MIRLELENELHFLIPKLQTLVSFNFNTRISNLTLTLYYKFVNSALVLQIADFSLKVLTAASTFCNNSISNKSEQNRAGNYRILILEASTTNPAID